MNQPADSRWYWLYLLGGIGALLSVVIILVAIPVYIFSPPPSTVEGFFELFQRSALLGLLAMDLIIILANFLALPLDLALYVALRKLSPSFMAIALAMLLVGMAAYFSSNTSFNMLALSRQYAAASDPAERDALVAAGRAMLTIYTGTAFHINYILGSVGLIIVSAVMLRGEVFSKATGWIGIAANGLALGLYLPRIGIYVSIFSVLFLAIWDVLVGLRLFRLARESKGM